MNFNQGELDFSGDGTEKGYLKWQQELDERKRAFEMRYGVIVGRRVRVCLEGEDLPLEGIITIVPQKKGVQSPSKLRLCLGGREFGTAEIESIIRIEKGDAG